MIDRADAVALDAADPLAAHRDRFVIDPAGPIYMDGNSLGRLPIEAGIAMEAVVRREWGAGLVTSWDRWVDLPQRLGATIAGIVGAPAGTVSIADSTTVNLFKLAAAAMDAAPDRNTIVTDSDNFPTDRYVLEGLARSRGAELRIVTVDPIEGITPSALEAVLDDDVALVSFSLVAYRSGALADMPAINRLAQAAGALTLWDLSHAVGSVPIDLAGSGTDLAVGCTYKYLNGGPGAPAFLYVRADLQSELTQPIWGWFAHEDQFAFAEEFRPAPGIERFLIGTPPILSTAAAVPGITMISGVGMEAIRAKSVAATSFMLDLYDERLDPVGIGLASPRDPARRGSHIAFSHAEGLGISSWMRTTGGVIVDFRAPQTIRVAVAPLYTTFAEIWDAVDVLRTAVIERRWASAPPTTVT